MISQQSCKVAAAELISDCTRVWILITVISVNVKPL